MVAHRFAIGPLNGNAAAVLRRLARDLSVMALIALALCLQPDGAASLPKAVWPSDLPPRNTVVDFETDFGPFRLPVGYHNHPELLPRQAIGEKEPGRPRYRLSALEFHFTMPDAHQNAALEMFWGGDDGGDGIGIDPARYAVWVTRMERPELYSHKYEVTVLDADLPTNQLVRTGPTRDPLESFYKGWTQADSSGERIGMIIGCSAKAPDRGSSGLCLGHMFFSDLNLDVQFMLQVERLPDVFSVARKTEALISDWRSAALKQR